MKKFFAAIALVIVLAVMVCSTGCEPQVLGTNVDLDEALPHYVCK